VFSVNFHSFETQP